MRWLLSIAVFLLLSPLHAQDTATVRLADAFQYPVGMDGKSYYKARGFIPNGHLGEDWNGSAGGDTDLGAPVTSVAYGLVVYARDFRLGWGNVIIIRHAYMEAGQVAYVDSLYGHLHEMFVREGQQVQRGQKIGSIGNNRGMYNAHLHFEMRKNLRVGMARSAFPRDFTTYWDPSDFIARRQQRMEGAGRLAAIPINTFVPYAGPADLDSALTQNNVPGRSPLSPNPNARPSANSPLRPRDVYKVDPYEDMRNFGY